MAKKIDSIDYRTEAESRTMAGDIPVFCAHDELLPLQKVIPNPKNPNGHPKEQIKLLSEIIKAQGWRSPITISTRSGFIVAGHGRRMAAELLGAETVPVEYQNFASEAEEYAALVADNRIAELAELDNTMLADILVDIDTGELPLELTGYAEEDLEGILDAIAGTDDAEPNDQDQELETPAKPLSQPGDLWELGGHRLIIGDATDEKTIERLMNGEKAAMVNTDPPYGVSYETQSGKFDMIKNDDKTGDDLLATLLLPAFNNYRKNTIDKAAFYIWHASSTRRDFEDAMTAAGLIEKQYLIWAKNGISLGRSDYQWSHEPCQPAGTMVRTPDGEVPIEQLKDGDEVVSFGNNTVKGFKNGYKVKVTNREYEGKLYTIGAAGKATRTTDGHRFTVRFTEGDKWCTYLMRKGNWWRLGITRIMTSRGFGIKDRLRAEKGDEAWLLKAYEDKTAAMVGEQLMMIKYGIPTTHWNIQRGTPASHRTEEQIAAIYDNLDLLKLQENAEQCLREHGRRIEYPLVERGKGKTAMSRHNTSLIRACNIMPEIMEVPVPYEKYETKTGRTFSWEVIDKAEMEEFKGTVYSMDVEKHHHYVADGIVTHNCFYASKAGQEPNFYGDRAQHTVWRITTRTDGTMMTVLGGGLVVTDGQGGKLFISDKPAKGKKVRYIRMEEGKHLDIYQEDRMNTIWEVDRETGTLHPTQKPVELAVRAIENSSQPGEIVLDFFGGSGSTLMGAEATGRRCYTTELDPRYGDVIISRYMIETGNLAATCTRDGKTYSYMEMIRAWAKENGKEDELAEAGGKVPVVVTKKNAKQMAKQMQQEQEGGDIDG